MVKVLQVCVGVTSLVGKRNKIVDIKIATPKSFDNNGVYHFSVKLYYYKLWNDSELKELRKKNKKVRRGVWTEILPYPQEVAGSTLNKFVAMIYGEANANSSEGMKNCVDATIRRIGDDSWGKITVVGSDERKTPMNLEEVLQARWFEAMGRTKYENSLTLKLANSLEVKAHNLAYEAVCTVVKETGGKANLTTKHYTQWLSASQDKQPGGEVIGGNRFREGSRHPGRPE